MHIIHRLCFYKESMLRGFMLLSIFYTPPKNFLRYYYASTFISYSGAVMVHRIFYAYMLLICYCTLPLHWFGFQFLSISLRLSNFFSHTSVLLILIMITGYILMPLLLWFLSTQLLCFYDKHFWVRIPIWGFFGRFQVWWTEQVPTFPLSEK